MAQLLSDAVPDMNISARRTAVYVHGITEFLGSNPGMSRLLDIMGNLILILGGNFIYIVGLKGLLVPHGFLNGGVFGICMIIFYLNPAVSLGILNALLNIPLLALGYFNVSRKFFLYTIFGMTSFSAMVDLVSIKQFPVQDPMLSAILGGVICGAGAGLVLRSAGSGGGMDILATYLEKKLSLRRGLTIFATNALILCLAAMFFNFELALYTLIFVFTQGRVTDAVITGFNKKKSIMIISDKNEEITSSIMNQLHRGATYLEGCGAYSGSHKRVVYSVITLTELARLKEIIFDIDPGAFVVVNDTLDVLGASLGKRKIY